MILFIAGFISGIGFMLLLYVVSEVYDFFRSQM